MAQGRSTEIITMIKWIRTSRFSIKNSLSLQEDLHCKRERILRVVFQLDDRLHVANGGTVQGHGVENQGTA